MIIERTKNTINGTIWGFMEKIANILLPFIVRTILIQKLGVDYLGLNSLFTSVLEVLNLTELGFGSAAIFAMYKPIADDDYGTVGAILNYLKKIYRLIGVIVIGGGLLFVPFLRYMIHGNVPNDINIYILFAIYVFNTAISYLSFAYKSSLLSALQCNNIISKIGLFISSCSKIMQIIILILIPNYYVYVIIIPIATILSNVIRARIVDKKYSYFLNNNEINIKEKENIKKRLFPLMSTKLAGVIVNSADTLVVSAFLGLSEVAIYNNYYYLMNSLLGFLLVIYNAMQAGIGNALVVDSHDKIMKDFNKFCFINNWIVSVCAACLLCLYQPFMELWVGKDLMLPFGMVILFVVYFYANAIQRIVVIYKDAAGIWRQDMLRCYLSVSLNLLVNIITVRYIGLYGVIGSSVVANIVGLPWMAYVLYKSIFKESSKTFYINELKDFIIATVICFVTYSVCNIFGNGLIFLIIRMIVCFCVCNICLFVVYGKTKQFAEMKEWIKEKITLRRKK